jgi:hypothetical protein
MEKITHSYRHPRTRRMAEAAYLKQAVGPVLAAGISEVPGLL